MATGGDNLQDNRIEIGVWREIRNGEPPQIRSQEQPQYLTGPSDDFDLAWPLLKASVMRYADTHRKRDVLEAIRSGKAKLWTTPNAALVTLLDTYPTGLKEIRGWLAGGDLEEIKGMIPQIEAYGRAMGCTRAVIHGRRGWLRAFDGYREAAVTMTKEL